MRLPRVYKLDMEGFEFFYQNSSTWNLPRWFGNQFIHLTKDGQCAMGSAFAYVYYVQGLGPEGALAGTGAARLRLVPGGGGHEVLGSRELNNMRAE